MLTERLLNKLTALGVGIAVIGVLVAITLNRFGIMPDEFAGYMQVLSIGIGLPFTLFKKVE